MQHTRRYETLLSGSEQVESTLKGVLPEFLNTEARAAAAAAAVGLHAWVQLSISAWAAAWAEECCQDAYLLPPACRCADHPAHHHRRLAGGGLAALHLPLRASQARPGAVRCFLRRTSKTIAI